LLKKLNDGTHEMVFVFVGLRSSL